MYFIESFGPFRFSMKITPSAFVELLINFPNVLPMAIQYVFDNNSNFVIHHSPTTAVELAIEAL